MKTHPAPDCNGRLGPLVLTHLKAERFPPDATLGILFLKVALRIVCRPHSRRRERNDPFGKRRTKTALQDE